MLLYILVDTIQIQGIAGTVNYMMWQLEDRYLDSQILSDYIETEAKKQNQEDLEQFFEDQKLYHDYISKKDVQQSSNKEPSRVLEFIRSPDDFYDWFEFVIDQIYGQGVDLSDEQLDNIIEFEN